MTKKAFRIFGLILSFILIFQSISFSQENDLCYVLHDLGEYKIVTRRYRVAPPHDYGTGPVYSYTDYGVIDKDGNVIVEQKYQEILPPSEGRAAFTTNESNIGFFDENWNIVIEPKYKNNRYPSQLYFSEGLVQVGKSHPEKYIVWGYIDRDGNEVIDFIYDSASPFKNGIAEVGINEPVYNYNTMTKSGKIDKNGNIVEPFKFGYATGKPYDSWWHYPIEVLLSENLVELNGRRYKNSDIEYPFINYLGYSYIPLTYYGCRMLGINCDWTEETGVVLSSGGAISEDIVGDNGMTERVYEKADIYKGKLTINGTTYEYGDTAYPLIHYKNVVYMPVLWQTGMEALGIEYSFIGAEKIENSDRGCMVFTTN